MNNAPEIYTKKMKGSHFDMSECKFPSIEIYKKQLENLNLLNLDSFSCEQIASVYFQHAVLMPIFYNIIDPDDFNTSLFYRVRRNVLVHEDKTTLKPFTYPDSSICKENGRANLKGKSVFYAADDYAAAIKESKALTGETIYLSIWQPEMPRETVAAMFMPNDLQEENLWKDFGLELEKYTKEYNRLLGHSVEQLDLLNEFILHRYLKEEAPYPLTSWISDEILFQMSGVDLICYPSIATNKYKCNVAVHPKIVDRHFNLKQIFELIIRNDNQKTGRLDITVLQIGKLVGGKILWSFPSPSELTVFGDHSVL